VRPYEGFAEELEKPARLTAGMIHRDLRRNAAWTLPFVNDNPAHWSLNASLTVRSSTSGGSWAMLSPFPAADWRAFYRRVCGGFYQFEKLIADHRIGYRIIKPNEVNRLRLFELITTCLVFSAVYCSRDHRRETRSAHAISSMLVFLHLLKGETEGCSQGFLVHAE
jgi:hypothetical protein